MRGERLYHACLLLVDIEAAGVLWGAMKPGTRSWSVVFGDSIAHTCIGSTQESAVCKACDRWAPYFGEIGVHSGCVVGLAQAQSAMKGGRWRWQVLTPVNLLVLMKAAHWYVVMLVAAGWTAFCSAQGVTTNEFSSMDEPAVFPLDSLVAGLKESGQPYLPFLTVPTLRAGLYALPAGGTDHQEPHDRDEVYYVIEGRSRMSIGGKQYALKPGDVIFVEALAAHRFFDIKEPLLLLVFFSEAER